MRLKSQQLIQEQSARIQRVLVLLAGMISVLVGLGVPALVLILGVLDHRTSLAEALTRQAAVVSRYVYTNPAMWPYEHLRLIELLDDTGDEYGPTWLRLVTADGKEVLQSGKPPDAFSLSDESPVRDGDRVVGTLYGAESLTPSLFQALFVALGAIPLAIALFAALWLGPRRISRLSFARLTEVDRFLAESAASLNKAQQIAKMGSWEWDLSSQRRRRWSEQGLRLFGYGDGIVDRDDRDWHPFVHPDDLASVRASIDLNALTGQSETLQYRLNRPDGTQSIIEEHIAAVYDSGGRTVGQTGVFQDVTDRQALEAQLAQAQKMEAIGKLTGGMAHDFNNYLGVIIGNLDLLSEREAIDPATAKLIADALAGALRAAELTRSLLAFSRRQPLDPRLTDVNRRLESDARLLKRTLGEDIALTAALAPELWPVRIDGAQLDSCIVNLANNARDAMPRGGALAISTLNVQLDEDYAKTNPEVAPGDHVLIEVSDTGAGMPPETVDRAFEPFFTTKPPGHGTGLGLSMVYGFVKQSGGHIKIYSEVGHGTVVRIYLPRDRKAGAAETVASGTPARASAPEGMETILVVEDNEQIRQTAVTQLAALGYRTIEAEGGAAALAILNQRERHLDLLFTDVVMPGELDGYALAKLARERRPGVKILLTSGFPGDTLRRNGKSAANLGLLGKPYRKDDLARAIRMALEAESPEPYGPT